MRVKLVVLFLIFIILSGCVSLDRYDEWDDGSYKTEKAELEHFESIRGQYEYVINFDDEYDRIFIMEENAEGKISDGFYRFANDTDREYVHYLLNLEELRSIAGGNLNRIAILIKSNNRDRGFVEIWPGDDLNGGNPNSVNNSGINNGSWSLLEFHVEGNQTGVIGSGFNKTLPKAINNISVFCFNGSKADLDYILFD